MTNRRKTNLQTISVCCCERVEITARSPIQRKANFLESKFGDFADFAFGTPTRFFALSSSIMTNINPYYTLDSRNVFQLYVLKLETVSRVLETNVKTRIK